MVVQVLGRVLARTLLAASHLRCQTSLTVSPCKNSTTGQYESVCPRALWADNCWALPFGWNANLAT